MSSAGESGWSSTYSFEIFRFPRMEITGTSSVDEPYEGGSYTAHVYNVQSVDSSYNWEVRFYPNGPVENYTTSSPNLTVNMGRRQYEDATVYVSVDVTDLAGDPETLAASMVTYIYLD